MQTDLYDLPISTQSDAAATAYRLGQHRLLGAEARIVEAFEDCIAHDPGFALGHVGLSRARQYANDMAGARAATATARDLAQGVTDREAGHIHAMGLLVDGKGIEAYAAIRAHVAEHPRDAVVAQTCTSVFGLIGFSGQPGREAEMLAFNASLLPHYGEDWWCLSQYAFALCETGQLDKATGFIDRSLARMCARMSSTKPARPKPGAVTWPIGWGTMTVTGSCMGTCPGMSHSGRWSRVMKPGCGR